MQGHLIIAAVALAASGVPAVAADTPKRQSCPKAEQLQQRQQQSKDQQQRSRRQGCPVERQIPPVVDPTPIFLL